MTIAPRSPKRQAIESLNRRSWREALELASHLIGLDSLDPELRLIAGVASLELGDARAAQDHLQHAVAMDPARVHFILYLARACAASQQYRAALDAANRAANLLAPDNAAGFDMLGVVLVQCHAYAQAVQAFGRASELAPDDAAIRFNLGTALTFNGDLAGAERELEAAVGIDPHHWRAHHSLSHLRKQTTGSNHVRRLTDLAAQSSGRVTATTFLNMALGKELEDLGDYDRAFQCYTVGKSAPRKLLRYSRDKEAALFNALSAGLPPHRHPSGKGEESPDPIFIVGMPRTGTTLVDRILSSHPLVQSAGELHNFPSAWKRSMGGPSFEMFNPDHILAAGRRPMDWHQLGKDYIESTRALRGALPFFTDKLPQNYLYLGYIANALPNARLVCVRRHPLDTCLSNFRQLFAPESPYFDYSYDLLDIGHYYVLFDRLMAHWNRIFPGRILEVSYEQLVKDQETNSRVILSHCGLEWDERCLAFQDNTSPVATASAAQVRRPLYSSSIGRWKRYEMQLAPLRDSLAAAGIDMPAMMPGPAG